MLGLFGLEFELVKADTLDADIARLNALDVIVCEPSGVQRNFVCKSLEGSGCNVHPIETAHQALAFIRGGIGDILITSIELPDMSGIELCWALKSSVDHAHVQTIVLSTHDDTRRIVEALDSGADDFIRKPVQKLEMQARIRAASRIVRLQRRLFDDANKDALTGVSNRRRFITILDESLNTGQQSGTPVSVIMIDLDKFKSINDTYGHAAGDEVLKIVSERTCSILKTDEEFGRLGGEEFALVLYGQTASEAAIRAEDFRSSIANTPVPISPTQQLNVTASLGVACSFDQAVATDQNTLLSRADAALYDAKANGRNQVREAVVETALRSSL